MATDNLLVSWQSARCVMSAGRVVCLVIVGFMAAAKLQAYYGRQTKIGIVSPSKELLLRQHIDLVRKGCADICNTSITGPDGQFYPQLVKNVDCPALWANKHIDASRRTKAVDVPDFLVGAFSYNGAVLLKRAATSSHGLLDQKYLGNPKPLVWTKQRIDRDVALCAQKKLEGTYGNRETNWAFEGLMQMPSVKGGHVLVVGSEQPWLECCALAAGATKVTTLEYREIVSQHPQIDSLTPDGMRRLLESGEMAFYDAVATFSSVEHSGLGRYGDALNPWGDLQTIARAYCVTRPGGGLLLSVMLDRGGGRIEFNAHRMYGPLMLSHLTANWIQDWKAPGGRQVVHVLHKPGNATFVNHRRYQFP